MLSRILFLMMISNCALGMQKSIQKNMLKSTNFKFLPKLQQYRYSSRLKSITEDKSEPADALPEKFNSTFLQTLLERGYIHQCTDFKGLEEKLVTTTVSAYLGFDATASSLHVGSLLQIMILRTLQKCGHRPIILIGGGTTKVGTSCLAVSLD